MSNKFGSRPNAERINEALTKLYNKISTGDGKMGLIFDVDFNQKYIILSDQHKGARDFADDFALAENNYLKALSFYNEQGFHYINLGDSEELWENLLESVIKHNQNTFDAERKFIARDAFTKIFGNHDLYWDNDPLSSFNLGRIYGKSIRIYEGAILRFKLTDKHIDIFLTHGHQGDLQSDGNWFSKWFVSTIWAPLQAFLMINPNTPAFDNQLKTAHNALMYSWVERQSNIALITGHTHQPVFASLTHLERLYLKIQSAEEANDLKKVELLKAELIKVKADGDEIQHFKKIKSAYFNAGCCCFNDGDITGIEIENGFIRLIKWSYKNRNNSERVILEEMKLEDINVS